MKIELESLTVNRFKGLSNYRLGLNGKSAIIRAQNGIGKTTLIDSLHWLFTGHDSDHRTKFGILEIDQNGQTVPKQDASVSGSFMFTDGQTGQTGQFEIKREFAQKWTQKRGQAKAELTNHTTRFFWDEIPVSKKDFEARLLQIARMDQINCLIDTDYFCSKMKPGDRRKVLMEMIDINSFDLEKPTILDMYTMDEAKKVLSQRKKKLNKTLEILPNRIDELKGMLPDGPEKSPEDIARIEKEIADIKEKLDVQRRGIIDAKESKQLKEIEKKIKDLSFDIQEEYSEKLTEIDDKNFSFRVKLRQVDSKLIDLNLELKTLSNKIDVNEAKRATLREKWKEEKDKWFTAEKTCYVCNQPIPKDQIQSQKEAFLKKKEETIEQINLKGKELYEKCNGMKEKGQALSTKIEETEAKKITFQTQIEELSKAFDALRIEKETTTKARLKDLYDEQKRLMGYINGIEAENRAAIIDLEKRLHELFYRKKEISTSIKDQIGSKIEAREKEMKLAAIEYEKVEADLMAVESYGMKRSEIIEREVNKHFALIKWRLFEHQVNGGIREICEPTVDGVLYNVDLNTGAKINAGIDAIKSLSRFFDLQFPLMIDNAESVTKWVSFDGQTVKMVADDNTTGLEVKLE